VDRFANDLDELEQNYKDLQHAVDNAEYYITLDSLEQGLDFVKTIDPSHKLWEAANAKCDRLRASLENLMPRGESA
jgi:hypothetical protein